VHGVISTGNSMLVALVSSVACWNIVYVKCYCKVCNIPTFVDKEINLVHLGYACGYLLSMYCILYVRYTSFRSGSFICILD